MVATVLRLRYRVLGNTLARRPWQLVGFCFGILSALWILGMVVAALVAVAALQGVEVARMVATLGGAALLLGWVLGPILIAGAETTVDAEKLAPFPLTVRQVMAALTATGLTGIPGIVTTLAALATVVLWVRWPVAAIIAAPCIALAVLTCVVASRLVTALSGGLGGNRRGREFIGTIVLVLLILAGPLATGTIALLGAMGDSAGLGTRLSEITGILGWTPLGASWSAPADVAAGAWPAALAKMVIAAATLAVLWLLWARVLVAAAGSTRRSAARVVKPGALGWFGRLPTGGVGATWARSLTGWLRDPRYLRQLIVVPIFPVLFAFTGGTQGFMFAASAVFVAFILCIAGYTDVSYDGTAFAAVLSAPIRGRDDRLGRVFGAACVGVPLTVLVAVVTSAIAGLPGQLPAILGAALGLLLAGYGVTAVSSALIVTPVPAAGDSPFKTAPGQTFVSGLMVFLVLGACVLVSIPSIGLAISALVTGSAMLGWLSLLVAMAVGVGAIVLGIHLGGRTLERTGPDLLMRIKAFPTT